MNYTLIQWFIFSIEAVVAAVLHGALEVLAGEVAGAIKATEVGPINSRGGIDKGVLHVAGANNSRGGIDKGVLHVSGAINSRGGDVFDWGMDNRGVIAKVAARGTVAAFGVIAARVDWRMNHRGSHVLNWSIVATEVLGRVHSRGGDVLNRGLDKRVLDDRSIDNGCAAKIAGAINSRGGDGRGVAAVLHGALEVLAGEVAGAIKARAEEWSSNISVKRHLRSCVAWAVALHTSVAGTVLKGGLVIAVIQRACSPQNRSCLARVTPCAPCHRGTRCYVKAFNDCCNGNGFTPMDRLRFGFAALRTSVPVSTTVTGGEPPRDMQPARSFLLTGDGPVTMSRR
jgi:hypothetical protein